MQRESKADSEVVTYLRLARGLRSLPKIRAPEELAQRAMARIGASSEVDGSQVANHEAAARFAGLEAKLGRIFVAYGPKGIRFVAPADHAETFAAAYERRFGVVPLQDESPPAGLLDDVARAVAGERRAARRLPLDLERLGSFERAVLAKALEIPCGEVRTYSWVAREIGRPTASRAVGRALGRNPIPFIIPCHRVVGTGGDLTGYAFGLPLKQRVLASEGIDATELLAAERRGERLRGSRNTRIFCFPTCHQARRIQPANVVPFRTEAEAVAHGYRACRLCRPAAVGE